MMIIKESSESLSLIIRFFSEIKDWFDMFYEQNTYLACLIGILFFLILVFTVQQNKRKKHREKQTPARNSGVAPGGYRNFKGDTWYPDGRVWKKDEQHWEEPDYNKEK
jgi:hypothetical protein